ncbi:hypothetical protein ACTFIU_004466 [Dictyostelium citrinum]
MALSLYYEEDEDERENKDKDKNNNPNTFSKNQQINNNSKTNSNNNNNKNKKFNDDDIFNNDSVISKPITTTTTNTTTTLTNSNINKTNNKFNDDDIFDDDDDDDDDKTTTITTTTDTTTTTIINDYRYQKTVPFSSFCDLMNRIINDTKISNKKNYLEKFMDHYKDEPSNFYQLLRLILPQLDKDRNTYGLKEKTLARLYVELLNISAESADAIRLLNWKKSTNDEVGGDFGTAVYLSLKNRCNENGRFRVSMGDINESLDQLSQPSTDKKTKVSILKRVLRSTTAQEQKWFVRIILKEMKNGLSEKITLKFFHPDAIDHFNITSNLRLVCNNLFYMPPTKQKELKEKLKLEEKEKLLQQRQQQQNGDALDIYKLEIKLFNPIKPMLANRQSIDNLSMLLNSAVSPTQFVIENKFDGERIQIHKDGEQVKYFSRNSNDSTYIYGSMFTPIVKESILAERCILDGELIVWDSISQRFEDFGNLKTLALNKDGISGSGDPLGVNYGKQLCFIAFDILFVKDQSVMNLPLMQRIMLLKRCVTIKPKQFEISEQTTVNSISQIISLLESAIINREEGLMLKNLHSLYVPAERKDKWVKIKPEYIDGMSNGADDLDLVIIGGYYGSGLNRRGGTISHFMLGVPFIPSKDQLDGTDIDIDDESSIDRNVIFYSFCKVGSGYTDLQLKSLQKDLDPHWNNFSTNKPPSIIQLAEPFKEKPDVWIDPRIFSKVLQIKAAQIVVTDKYKCGYTLRFPRVLKIRDDKGWKDCCSHEEIIDLYTNYSTNLNFKRVNEYGDDEKTKKSKKLKKTTNNTNQLDAGGGGGLKVLSIFQDTDTSGIIPSQTIFQGIEICVIKGSSGEYTKSRLEIMIVEMGGSKVQYPSRNTNYVISSKEVVKIQNLIQSGFIDIVSFNWIVDCYNEKRLIPLGPKYMIFTTESTKKRFLLDSDQFGDSYFNETTEQSLKDAFNQIDKLKKQLKDNQLSKNTTSSLSKYFSGCWWSLFKDFTFYLDLYQVVGEKSTLIENNNLELSNLNIQFYGGKISTEFNNRITHVVLDSLDLSRITFIKKKINSLSLPIQIVTTNWIQLSINNYSIQPILEILV